MHDDQQPPDDQHIDNSAPNQGAQGVFHGTVDTGTHISQPGQQVAHDQYVAAGDIHIHYPIGNTVPTKSGPYDNLPPPSYFAFVMREQAFTDVASGLRGRYPVVVIVSLGGMGKTSLAREIAGRCLVPPSQRPLEPPEMQLPHVDAVVWVSDMDAPGNLTITVLFDTIARTLKHEELTQLEPAARQHAVETLLRERTVLLVIDNAETIQDSALIAWLTNNLPEPSKALVTSRERSRELFGWLVELRGMTTAEAHAFIVQRLTVLRRVELCADMGQFAPLLEVTGGNPKAIAMALGQIHYRPLPRIVNDLYQARHDIFSDLFTHAWARLSSAARSILFAALLFPTSAVDDALRHTAGLEWYDFDKAVEDLTERSLLDEQGPQQRTDTPRRYSLHPLVRAFVQHQHDSVPAAQQWLNTARPRWAAWVADFAGTIGWTWDDIARLRFLDAEEKTVDAALTWAAATANHAVTLAIAQGVDHYYYVSGLWDKKAEVDRKRIYAAHCLNNKLEEVRSIAQYVQMLCNRGTDQDLHDAQAYLPTLEQFVATAAIQDAEPAAITVQVYHALAFYAMATNAVAQALTFLVASQQIATPQHPNLSIATLRWMATCQYDQGQHAEAERVFQEAIQQAAHYHDQRAQVMCELGLAQLALDRGDMQHAEKHLAHSLTQARIHHERRYIAHIQLVYAQLYCQRQERLAAEQALAEAAEILHRFGLYATRLSLKPVNETMQQLQRAIQDLPLDR